MSQTAAIDPNASEMELALELEQPKRGSKLMRPVEMAASALLVLLICLLLLGVVSRYVFSLPLIWVDEVASLSFLWLAMLGSAIAFDRNEHLRLTLFLGKMPERLRVFVDAFAPAVAAAFLLALVYPAFEYA